MKKLLLPITILCTTTLFAQDDYYPATEAAEADTTAIDTSIAYEEWGDKAGYDDFSFDPRNLENFEFNGVIYKVYPYVLQAPYEPNLEGIAVEEPVKLSKKQLKKLEKAGYDIEEMGYDYAVDSAKAGSYYAQAESWDGEIPPLAYAIPDSNYVLLQWQKDETRRVRAVFSMSNMLLEGSAIFYDENNDPIKLGSYKNGLKDGVWNTYLYANGQSYNNTLNYVDGNLQGPFKEYANENNVVFVEREGEYQNGYVLNEKRYRLLPNNTTSLQKELITLDGVQTTKEYDSEGHLIYEMASNDNERLSTYTLDDFGFEKIGKNPFEGENYYLGYSFAVPNAGVAKYYYKNGDLCAKFSNPGSYESSEIFFDTIYAPNKKILLLRSQLLDSVGIARCEIRAFSDGKVIGIHREMVRGYYNNRYEKFELNEKGVLELTEANYRSFYDNSTKVADKMYLVSIRRDKRMGVNSFEYRMPQFENTAFIKGKSIKGDFSLDFVITDSSAANFAFQNIVTIGDAKMVMFSHRDLNPVKGQWKDLSLTGAVQRTLRTGREFARDSVKFYYKDKLFTGKIHLFFGKGDRLVHFKKGMIALDIMAVDMVKKEFGKKTEKELGSREKGILKSFLDLSFKQGDLTHIMVNFHERREHIVAEAELEKSALHGKAYGEMVKRNYEGEIRKKERIECDFYYGLPHGDMVELRWNKNTDTWLRESVKHYCYGAPCDTSYKYDDGKVRRMEVVYNKEGKRHGELKKYNHDGIVESLETYKNGVLDGLSISFNSKGDTTFYAMYVDGKKEGKFYMSSSEYADAHYTLSGNYKKGKLSGQQVLRDGNNTVRMIATAHDKSFISGYNDMSVEYMLKSPFYSLKIEGEYEFFYDNGVKYCEAKTVLDSNYMQPTEGTYDEAMYEEAVAVADSARAMEDYAVAASAEPDYPRIIDNGFIGVTQVKVEGVIKRGTWKYYFPDGKLQYVITYADSSKLKVGKEIVYGCGYYQEYYNNGKLMAKGLLLDETNEQECETDLFENSYKVLYTDFYAIDGKSLMTNSTGSIKKYYSNQLVREEGKYINGKKEGWWKEFNREGKLIFVGRYVNGLPDGRWLHGDLQGINYLDDRCFESMQKEQEAIEEAQYYLEISETFYKNGVEIKSNYYTFKRAGGEEGGMEKK